MQIVFEMVAIDVALQFVRGEQHHHIGPFGGIGDALHLKPGSCRLFGRSGILAQGDADLFDARIPEVQGMRMALASIADDRDFLALDEIDIGIEIIINAHGVRGPVRGESGFRRGRLAIPLGKRSNWAPAKGRFF